MQQGNPNDVLNEGLSRAKNMAVAFAMVLFLLAKLFFVKIVWRRLQALGSLIVVRAAMFTSVVWTKVEPHWVKFKQFAAETKIKAIRIVLTALITALTPVESAAVKVTGVAKVHSEKIATKTTMTFAQMMSAFVTAVGSALSAGFSKPAMQKMLNKLFALLEEAQK